MTTCSPFGAGVGVEGLDIAEACLRVRILDMAASVGRVWTRVVEIGYREDPCVEVGLRARAMVVLYSPEAGRRRTRVLVRSNDVMGEGEWQTVRRS